MSENYSSYEMRLAREIANTLKDTDSLAMHLKYVRQYKEEYLRRIMYKVMSLDESQIKRSRAALYNFLINQGEKYGGVGH